MTEIEKLEPCPFCGGSAHLDEIPPHSHGSLARFMPDHPGSFTIECDPCGAGLIDDDKATVIARWNRREPASQLLAALKGAEGELTELRALRDILKRQHDLREAERDAAVAALVGRDEMHASLIEQTALHASLARPNVRMALAIAANAIRRGRHLTEAEKIRNLFKAMDEFDTEEEARAALASNSGGG